MPHASSHLASQPFSRRCPTCDRLFAGRKVTAYERKAAARYRRPLARRRRFRDLMQGYEAEFEVVTEFDRSTIRTAVTLALKIEEMEAAQLRGKPVDAGELTRLAGQLRRLLADLKRTAEGNAPALAGFLRDLGLSVPTKLSAAASSGQSLRASGHRYTRRSAPTAPLRTARTTNCSSSATRLGSRWRAACPRKPSPSRFRAGFPPRTKSRSRRA